MPKSDKNSTSSAPAICRRVLLCLVVGILISGCGKESQNKNINPKPQKAQEVDAILENLNAWDSYELKLLNGNRKMDQEVSGETISFVESRIDQIRSLGFDVEWDERSIQYVLVEQKKR